MCRSTLAIITLTLTVLVVGGFPRAATAVDCSAVSIVTGASDCQSTSPGKFSVFASAHMAQLSTGGGPPLLMATIGHGKHKYVLAAEARISSATTGLMSPFFWPEVNGVRMNPTDGANLAYVSTDCSSQRCSLTGTWWLDLDAAEAAHPGMFLGVPLVVNLQGGDLNGAAVPAGNTEVTMTLRLQKR